MATKVLNIGNSGSSVTVDSNINGNVLPQVTGTYNLGSSSLKWNNIYGNLKGNADNDGSGNVISDTYVKKAGDTMTGLLTVPKLTSTGVINSGEIQVNQTNANGNTINSTLGGMVFGIRYDDPDGLSENGIFILRGSGGSFGFSSHCSYTDATAEATIGTRGFYKNSLNNYCYTNNVSLTPTALMLKDDGTLHYFIGETKVYNKNDLITMSDYTVLHSGNYASFLDSRYVNATGDTINGTLYINRSDNNVPSLYWNKRGSYWGGIGYHGTENENYLGPCDSSGNWVDADTDTWYLRGDIKTSGTIKKDYSWISIAGISSFNCVDGTTITQPGGANPLVLYSGAASGRDTGILWISNDNAYIANSSDNAYTFSVFDTDITQDFSTYGNASLSVRSNGGGTFIRGLLGVAGINDSYTLFVNGTSYFNNTMYLGSTTGFTIRDSAGTWILGKDDNSTGRIHLGSTANAQIVCMENSVGNVWLNGSGNVGIGTSSPSYKLDVNGAAKINTRLSITNDYHGIMQVDGVGATQSLPLNSSSSVTITVPGSAASVGTLVYACESASSDYGICYVGSDGCVIANSGDNGYVLKVMDKDQTADFTSTSTGFSFGVKQGGAGSYCKGTFTADSVYGAVWNDYAEFRKTSKVKFGQVVQEVGDGSVAITESRLIPGCSIVSDTFGFAIGEQDNSKTPLAVSGRVLAYPLEDRNSYKPGAAVCSGPNGTVSTMTREEIREYPDCIIGYVSEIPTYETWGTGNVVVDGRIWIKLR